MQLRKSQGVKMNKLLFTFVSGIALGVLLSFLIVAKPANKTYIYVDVDKIISRIIKEISLPLRSKSYGGQDSSVENLTTNVDSLKANFELALTDYEKTHNAIIFSSPKPIKGAIDKTDYFLDQIIRQIKNDSGKQK